jgi:hypothetical protein
LVRARASATRLALVDRYKIVISSALVVFATCASAATHLGRAAVWRGRRRL